jgi:hypothetical protein
MIKKVTMLIAGLIFAVAGLYGQGGGGVNGAWDFVGPYSNNNANLHEFETAHMNSIISDPDNYQHLFACSKFGGLWESTDYGANWYNISTVPTGLSGVLGIAFRNSSEILVGNYHPSFAGDYSNNVSLYNFITGAWTNLTVLPLPVGSSSYAIKSVAVLPGNPSVLFACTTVGLFRSPDGGSTWALTSTGCIENMVFMPKAGPGYYTYIAGSNAPADFEMPTGTAMLKESSDDGLTFSDISSTLTIDPVFLRSHTKICLGPVNTSTGNSELLAYTVAVSGTSTSMPGWDYPSNVPTSGIYIRRYVHELVKNITTGSGVTLMATLSNVSEHPSSDRMAIIYDEYNALVWFGGITLNCFNLNTNSAPAISKSDAHLLNCKIHNDLHEFIITNAGGQYTMLAACDGGIAKASLDLDTLVADPSDPGDPGDTLIVFPSHRTTSGIPDPTTICFEKLNNGINVCLINGFSGSAEHPNLYAIGGQDIVNTDIYDSGTGNDRYTHNTWENDGALIYKFNDSLMILDGASYTSNYYVSVDEGHNLNGVTPSPYGGYGFYNPKSTAPFEANTSSSMSSATEFGAQRFKQDPYRPGRIYSLGHRSWPHFMQYDFNAKRFAVKTRFDNYMSPDVKWITHTQDISFSPQTPSSIYMLLSNRYIRYSTESYASVIFKYIGPDFDDLWQGHNDYTYAGGFPQWQDISPVLSTFSSIGGGAVDVTDPTRYGLVSYMAVETSPWSKDIIYVACNIENTGPNKAIKMLKYNGTSWTDYSLGIPVDEVSCTMIMDHASNDGIYLATDKSVYFRDADMSNWIYYGSDLPILFSKQMEINYVENTVRTGTYGMGIWKSSLHCPHRSNYALTGSIVPHVYEAANITANGVNTMTGGPTAFRGTNSVTLTPGFIAVANSASNTYCVAYIHGCISGSTSPGMYRIQPMLPQPKEISQEEEKEMQEEVITIYPNPSTGIFKVEMKDDEKAMINVYNMKGEKVKSIVHKGTVSSIDLSGMPKGVYMVKVITEDKSFSEKIVLE